MARAPLAPLATSLALPSHVIAILVAKNQQEVDNVKLVYLGNYRTNINKKKCVFFEHTTGTYDLYYGHIYLFCLGIKFFRIFFLFFLLSLRHLLLNHKPHIDHTMRYYRYPKQRWSRGHKARGQGQGHKKNPRPRTAFPRTDTLEAKVRNAQGQGPRTQAQVLSKKKKRSSQKFFKRSPQKNVFQKIFQPLHKILTIQKIVLSSSRVQANFRGLEASRPRPRASACVLEDSISDPKVLVHA